MKTQEYNEIVSTIKKFKGLTRDCARMLVAKYSTSYHPFTLYSILAQEIQQKMKITHNRVFGTDANYYDMYLQALQNREPVGILIRLAVQLNTCPALLARKVLEAYCKADESSDNKNVNKMMKNTALIPDGLLAYEIYMCILYDDQYGPISTTISDSIGVEYEVKLENLLTERGIQFYNEDHLKQKGYDKTPDCKLEVPIAVNGFVINWIESKARFGSPDIHKTHIKKQFLSYWNRFGPGLVIYWFGFVDSIAQPSETKFIVVDHFPENITYMDPDSLLQINMSIDANPSTQSNVTEINSSKLSSSPVDTDPSKQCDTTISPSLSKQYNKPINAGPSK